MKILVANNRGGVGKSLVSYYAMLALANAGVRVAGVEIDNSKRLSLLFKAGAITSFQIGPSFAELQQNPERGIEHWGPILDLILGDDACVVDFGANVPKVFFEVLRIYDADALAAIKNLTVLVPVTSDDAAIEGAALVVENARRLLPSARVILCCNTFLGGGEIVDLRFDGIERVVLPNGRGIEVLEQAYQVSNIAPADIMKLTAPEIGKMINKSGATAVLKFGQFKDWHRAMYEAISGLVAPLKSAAARKVAAA